MGTTTTSTTYAPAAGQPTYWEALAQLTALLTEVGVYARLIISTAHGAYCTGGYAGVQARAAEALTAVDDACLAPEEMRRAWEAVAAWAA
jgi:hypothetical protein